jgi:hypothetical protein
MIRYERSLLLLNTQVQLTENQVQSLSELYGQGNESIDVSVQRAIEQSLKAQQIVGKDRYSAYRQAAGVIGKYRAKCKNISVQHDLYLNEAWL